MRPPTMTAGRRSLMIATLGLFELYWFYRHWLLQRRAGVADVWPIWRALFSIFFAWPLFRRVHDRARAGAALPSWEPGSSATVYVIASLIDGAAWRGGESDEPWVVLSTTVLGLVTTLWTMLVLWSVQASANAVCGDAGGAANVRLTGANWGWIVAGSIFWSLTLAGILITFAGVE